MRKMKHREDDDREFNIVEVIATNNFWEFFVTDEKFNDHVVRCVVSNPNCTEIGDVDLREIEYDIAVRTKDLRQAMPARGYEWA